MTTLLHLPLPGPIAAADNFMVMLIVGVIWVVVQIINKRAQTSQPPPHAPQEPAPDLNESPPVENLSEFLEKLKGDLPKASPSTHRAPPPTPLNPTVFHKAQNPNFSHAQRSPGPAALAPIPANSPPALPAQALSKPNLSIEPLPVVHPQYPELIANFSNRKALVQFILAREILGQPLALRRPESESR